MALKAAAVLAASIFCACQSTENGIMEPLTFTADEIGTAYRASGGRVWYPRMITLVNGEWICGFDTNEDGGNGVIKVIISNDQGVSWPSGVIAAARPGADLANAQLVQRRDGELWLAYRAVERRDGRYITSLLVSRSDNNGRSWEVLPGGEIARENSDQFKGVWEPHMGYMEDSLVCMYADDNYTVIDHGGQQTLFMKTWTGNGWSDPVVVSDGRESNGRDGMPVWSRMKDGRYIVVFETSDENAHYPFVVKYKISPDGFNWNVPRHTLYTPGRNMKQGGAPYVITLADGRLAASLQSDESKARYGVEVCDDKIFIADPKAGRWEYLCDPFPTNEITHAVWNSLMPLCRTAVLSPSVPPTIRGRNPGLSGGGYALPGNIHFLEYYGHIDILPVIAEVFPEDIDPADAFGAAFDADSKRYILPLDDAKAVQIQIGCLSRIPKTAAGVYFQLVQFTILGRFIRPPRGIEYTSFIAEIPRGTKGKHLLVINPKGNIAGPILAVARRF
jgi:hypothetical protein